MKKVPKIYVLMMLAITTCSFVWVNIQSVKMIISENSIDVVEGVVLAHQLEMQSNQKMYGKERLENSPYSIPLYGPIYYYVSSLGIEKVGYTGGRLLSSLIVILLVFLSFFVLKINMNLHRYWALFGSSIWLTLTPVVKFLGVYRCDWFAILFSILGFVLLTYNGKRNFIEVRKFRILGMFFLVFAFFIKPTVSVAPFLAWLVYEINIKTIKKNFYLIWFAIVFFVIFLICHEYYTGGDYIQSIWFANANPFSFKRGLWQWMAWLGQFTPWLTPLIIIFSWKNEKIRAYLFFLLLSSFVSMFTVFKEGANLNYFIQWCWIFGICTAATFSELYRNCYEYRSRILVAFFPILLLSYQLFFVHANFSNKSNELNDKKVLNELIQMIPLSEPVLSLYVGEIILNNRIPYMIDPHIVSKLWDKEFFPTQKIIHELKSGKVKYFISESSYENNTNEIWCDPLRKVLKNNFSIYKTTPKFNLYKYKKEEILN